MSAGFCVIECSRVEHHDALDTLDFEAVPKDQLRDEEFKTIVNKLFFVVFGVPIYHRKFCIKTCVGNFEHAYFGDITKMISAIVYEVNAWVDVEIANIFKRVIIAEEYAVVEGTEFNFGIEDCTHAAATNLEIHCVVVAIA